MAVPDVQQRIEEIFPDYRRDLARLVAAPSVNAPAQPGAPFGAGIKAALDTMLNIAQRMGFKTHADPGGYYGYAEIGEGAELFGVLGHLDVVPVEPLSDWATDPFTLTEKDGKLYGRGAQDDKGPTLAALYALRLLLDSGAKLSRRVRFIFGTDEESLWRGIKAYVAREEHPSMGFTPDSNFPLNFAEKGLINYELTAHEKTAVPLTGGTVYNAVPSHASTPFGADVEQALKDLGYEYESADGTITALGKTVHSMVAPEGTNAIVRLAQAMRKAGKSGAMLRFIDEMGRDPLGTPIFGAVEDDVSGKLTFNIGVAKIGDGAQMIGVDMRTPVSYTKEQADAAIKAAAQPYGIEVKDYDYLRPIHIDVESELVRSLMRAYREVTGDTQSQPIASGGATYARSMDNIVAFGASFPGHDKTEHQANEFAVPDDLKLAMQVYVRAFELLVTA